jgi:hypothetical protein
MKKKPTLLLGRNPCISLFVTIFLLLLLSFQHTKAQIPNITSFSPASGSIGTAVTIKGTNFNTTTDQNIVFFGATKAIVTAATNGNTLTVTVPTGATYQPISVLNLANALMGSSAAPFRVTFSGGFIDSNSLDTKVDFTTGSTPYSVTIGDLDGDGKSDLAIANYGSNTVSVFRNTSVGGRTTSSSFATKVDFPTGVGPVSVSIGDVDGDGKPELATANHFSNTVSVLRNTAENGNITSSSFAGKVDFTTGIYPTSVSMSDLDGDGKPELAVANSLSATVSVFHNTSFSGSISFMAKVDFNTDLGLYPYSISVGDLDGDGKPELTIANFYSNSVSVFRNTAVSGSITTTSFSEKVDYITGSSPYSVSIGDLDGDGKPELAIANYGSATVSILRNNSSSGSITTSSFATKVDFTTGENPISVSISDLDGNGKSDLAVANYGSSTVSVFRNTATIGSLTSGSFATKVDYVTGDSPFSVNSGDLDGDGKPELAIANTSGSVSILGNNPKFPPNITSFSPTSGYIGTTVTITGSNFNATANQNVVFFGATKATVTAASTISLTVTVPSGATYQPLTVLNLATALIGSSATPFRVTFTGGAIATNSLDPKVDFTTGSTPYSLSMGDLDGDGKSDLVVANYGSATISVFRNTSVSGSTTSNSFAPKVDFPTGTGPYFVSIGDLDRDGKPELAVANYGSATISIFRNTATSGSIINSSFATKVDFTTGTGPVSMSMGDLDGDGKPELAVANYSSSTVSVFRNTATNGSITSTSFANKIDFTTGTSPRSVSMGDLDGDSKPELATANYGSSTVSVFRNTSLSGSITNASFAGKVDFTTHSSPYSVSIGDLDGDGKPDLTVANFYSATVSIFRNTASSGNLTSNSFATKVDFATGSGSRSVSIGDLDGDGKPDLAIANLYSATVSVLRNMTSSGSLTNSSFATKMDFTTGAGPAFVSIGDLDGDGKPELAIANSGSNTVSVFRNNPKFPQGSLTANGPFCSGTGKLTWVTTEGTGPFTVIYNDGTANRTITNVTSGTAFEVFTNPVISTTTYTLVSVMGSDAAVRTSGFTVGSAIITINPKPTAIANSNSPLCAGNTISLTGEGVGTYLWNGPSGFSSTLQSPSITNATILLSGVYTLTITNTQGCSSTTTTSVTVNALPIATASSNSPLCAGNTLSLSGGGGGTYLWNGPMGFSSTAQSPSITDATTLASEIYTISVTNANNCTNTATTSVTVNTLPTATASSSTPTICAENTLSLIGGGVGTYAWTGVNGFTSTEQNPNILNTSSLASGTYRITITNLSGCSSTATTSVTVNALPTATASSNSPICVGNTLSLTGGGIGTYLWSGPSGFSSTLQNLSIVNATALASGIYTITVTNANGCTSTATTSVTVNTNPVVTASSNSPVCAANTISLMGGGVGRYLWNGPNGFTSTDQNPSIPNANSLASGTYRITITNVSGCTSTATTSVTVNPIVVIPTPQANTQLILGSSVTLTATGCTGTGFMIKWYQSSNNTLVAMPVSPSVTTNYYAICEQTANGVTCLSAKSNTLTLTVINRIFVDITKIAAPIQNGNSWATAYGNLQTALAAATATVEVWVAKGIYKPTATTTRTIYFEIPTNVKVYGGFAGTESALSDRNFITNVSTLSGDIGTHNVAADNTYHVVVLSGSSTTTVLDGFTITGGNANTGIQPASPAPYTAPPLTTTLETGGGIVIQNGGNPTIANCMILNNVAVFGGGLYASNASIPTIRACQFSGNQATFGSGLYFQDGSNGKVNNTLIAGNKGMGGVYNSYSNPIITNCTFSGNGGYNGGIFNSASQPVVKNSILWGNAEPFNDTQSIITYSIVQGGYAGMGNLTADPQFVSPAPFGLAPNTSGDYHLKATSLAINRGDNEDISLTDKDLAGNLREFSGGRVDMGAYEFQGAGTSTLIISVVTGPWEANSTWDLGRVPQLGDYVIIENNHIVTLSTTGMAKHLEYRGTGTLKFNLVTSKLELGF